jgi:hypothetical protein
MFYLVKPYLEIIRRFTKLTYVYLANIYLSP